MAHNSTMESEILEEEDQESIDNHKLQTLPKTKDADDQSDEEDDNQI